MKHFNYRLAIAVLIVASIPLFSNCKKNNDECETWLVQDYCFPKNATVRCFQYDAKERSICGDELNLAKEGKVKVRKDDADIRLTTVYIRKVG